MRIALYQPDIPQNTGTILRMAACFNVPVDIIEPCGFVLNDRRMQRAGMDYMEKVDMHRHNSWQTFTDKKKNRRRLILLSTKATTLYADFKFHADDTLLLGQESAGAPEEVHQAADAIIKIPGLFAFVRAGKP